MAGAKRTRRSIVPRGSRLVRKLALLNEHCLERRIASSSPTTSTTCRRSFTQICNVSSQVCKCYSEGSFRRSHTSRSSSLLLMERDSNSIFHINIDLFRSPRTLTLKTIEFTRSQIFRKDHSELDNRKCDPSVDRVFLTISGIAPYIAPSVSD